MRSHCLIGAALVCASVVQHATAQTQAPLKIDERASSTDRLPVWTTTEPVSVPFELRDNLVILEATIEGRRQAAVLDSGTGTLAVDRTLAEALRLQEGTSTDEVAGAGPQAQQIRPVTIGRLQLGPLGFADLPGHLLNLQQLSVSAGFPITMLIGVPAFRYGSVRVDYRARTVTFGPSGSTARCMTPIPLAIVHDVPVVEVELVPTPSAKPIRLKLVVDLGTRHSAAMSARKSEGGGLSACGWAGSHPGSFALASAGQRRTRT